jgi:hypothetical protein
MNSLPWIIGSFILGGLFGYVICAIITIGRNDEMCRDIKFLRQ